MNDTRFAEAVDEQTQMLRDAYKYPTRLMATVARLPLDDALDVYAAASNEEKKALRREIALKIQSCYQMVERGKKPYSEYKALAPRWTIAEGLLWKNFTA